MKVNFKNIDPKDIAVISGEFIKNYMPGANGEYIKVYLYLIYNAKEELQLTDIACDVELTENDVKHALKYWLRHDLISIENPDTTALVKADNAVKAERKFPVPTQETDIEAIIEENNTYDIERSEEDFKYEYEQDYEQDYEEEYSEESSEFGANYGETYDLEEDYEEELIPKEASKDGIEKAKETELIPEKKPIDSIKLGQDEEFGTLLYFIQMCIKKNLSQHVVERVAYMYESLDMSADLIEYMVESCVEKGKTSLRYMEKIAIDWYEKGIDSIEKAKKTANIYPKEVWEIMKAFGISSRLPGSGEVSYMNKWLQEYAFSIAVIKEACDRTLLNAQKPSFHYADSILSRWYKLGIKSIDEIGLKDIKKDRIKTVETQRPRQTAKLNNRFINFEQRDDSEEDLNNLINERLRQRLGQGKLRGSLDGVK